MPRYPPEYPEAISAEHPHLQTIDVYSPRKEQVWIHLNYVPWVVEYMFIQQAMKCVDLLTLDDSPRSDALDAGHLTNTDNAGDTPHV